VRVLNKRQDVYNLEVDSTHNFIVNNGIVVHNCMDALRYALEPLNKIRAKVGDKRIIGL